MDRSRTHIRAKDEVLIVVKHAILGLVAHSDGSANRHLKYARVPCRREARRKVETLDDPFDHSISAVAVALHA